METYIEYLQNKGQSSSSIAHHLGNLERYLSWARSEDIPEGATRQADLLFWARGEMERGISKRTINQHLNSIRHYFNMLIAQGVLSENPVSQVRIKGETKKLHNTLSEMELEALYLGYGKEAYKANIRGGIDQGRRSWLSAQRNKNLLGMMIYQGLTSGELQKLRPEDLKLREGIIEVPATRRSNGRTLKLESHQILDLMEYMLKTREEILELTGKESEMLFVSLGSGSKLQNSLQKLIGRLKQENPRLVSHGQIRASVITGWLRKHNLRKVQYMAGHRYISSTEAYLENDVDGLLEELEAVMGGMGMEFE